MNKLTVPALAAGLLAWGTTAAAQTRDVAKVFAETCASCHGAKLQGGQAASLLDEALNGPDRVARLVPAP